MGSKLNKSSISCSIGICVYNEEKNIEKLLLSLLEQKLKNVRVDEIIVVSSGSTDNTYQIVKKYSNVDKRIKLIRQPTREGKASAVNFLIQRIKSEILVISGADLLLTSKVIQKLVEEFFDPEIGMTGARPIPLNNIKDGVCGFAAHLLWDLHHRVSLEHPKMGEVIAFRKIFRRIPVLSSVDEANIEPLIRGQGYLIKYTPEAKIYNKAPETIKDFIRQRRRIYSGHLAVKHEQSYEVATMRVETIVSALFSFLKDHPNPRYFILLPFVIFLEAYSRFLGWWDYRVIGKRHTVWDVVESTKSLR